MNNDKIRQNAVDQIEKKNHDLTNFYRIVIERTC